MSTEESKASVPTAHDTQTPSDVIVSLPNGFGVRRYREGDGPSQARNGNNPKVYANLRDRMPQPYTEKDANEWIERNSKPENWIPSGAWTREKGQQGPKVPAHYTITFLDESIGSIGVEPGDPNDVHGRCAEIGYWIGEEHWGKGGMSTVVPAFVEWVWKTFDILIRLEADAYDRNPASVRVLEKAGFKHEGRKKWAYVKNGKVGDVIVLGCTRPGLENP